MTIKTGERFFSLPIINNDGDRTDCDGCDTSFKTEPKITPEGFLARLKKDGIPDSDLPPIDQNVLNASTGSPLAQTIQIGNKTVGNRCVIHPMEGWDANPDGTPTDLTYRRWRRMGESGAKLIWGGEAFAVDQNGRANPRQLFFSDKSEKAMGDLLRSLKEAHNYRYGAGADKDLMVGLQLTDSGRFSKPNKNNKSEPRIMYHHPLLDRHPGFPVDPKDNSVVFSDDQIGELIDKYVNAAKMAKKAGYDFVDIKACHGYLLHESLSAFDRKNPDGSESIYGGSYENRTRLLKTIIKRIRNEVPDLEVGVRLSAFDTVPFEKVPGSESKKYPNGKVKPMDFDPDKDGLYPGFGVDRRDPSKIDLTEPKKLIQELSDPNGDYRIAALNVTAGSPYYSWLIQRPGTVPAGGIAPSEDPYTGATRHLMVTKELKKAAPDLPIIASAMTPFMELFPNISQPVIKDGYADMVGLGRGFLSAPHFFDHILKGQDLEQDINKICRTLSECTNSVRNTDTDGNAFKSACFPFDKDPRVLYHKARYHEAVGKKAPKVPVQRILVALNKQNGNDPFKAAFKTAFRGKYGQAYPGMIQMDFAKPQDAATKLATAQEAKEPYKLAIVENSQAQGEDYHPFTEALKSQSDSTFVMEFDRDGKRNLATNDINNCGDTKLRCGAFDKDQEVGSLSGKDLPSNPDSFDYLLDQSLFAFDKR